MSVRVILDGARLVSSMVRDLSVAGMTPLAAVTRALNSILYEAFGSALEGRLLKPPGVRKCGNFGGGASTLLELASTGCDMWYTEVALVTRLGEGIENLQISCNGLELIPINYGQGVERAMQIKTRPLKRQTNHKVCINHLRVPGGIFKQVALELTPLADLQPLIANFSSGPTLPGYRTVAFDHMITGTRVFCQCARRAHDVMRAKAEVLKPQYVESSWVHEVVALLKDAHYGDSVCHLCLAQSVDADEPKRRYGASIEYGFEAYIDQLIFDEALDRRTARERVKQILGMERWVKESALHSVLRDLFPDEQVLREASPAWLERMRFDIFLPRLALAIEYQGQQHFQPVSAFGGADGYARLLKRDEKKRQLCKEHGVNLVEVRYDAPITTAAIRQRLRRYLRGSRV
jgi:hypothetical protein